MSINEQQHEILAMLARGERIFTYHHLSARWGYFHASARHGHPTRMLNGIVDDLHTEGYVDHEPFDPRSTSKYIWVFLTEKGRVALQEQPKPVVIPDAQPLPIEDIFGSRHVTVATKWRNR